MNTDHTRRRKKLDDMYILANEPIIGKYRRVMRIIDSDPVKVYSDVKRQLIRLHNESLNYLMSKLSEIGRMDVVEEFKKDRLKEIKLNRLRTVKNSLINQNK